MSDCLHACMNEWPRTRCAMQQALYQSALSGRTEWGLTVRVAHSRCSLYVEKRYGYQTLGGTWPSSPNHFYLQPLEAEASSVHSLERQVGGEGTASVWEGPVS